MPYTTKQISEELAINHLGLKNLDDVFWNLPTATLYEHALRNHEGKLAANGALLVRTGHVSGQSVKDKYIVANSNTYHGEFRHSMTEHQFEALLERVRGYLEGQSLYVEDTLVAAESGYDKAVRFICQDAWHCLFSKNMFVRPTGIDQASDFTEPDFTIIHVPHFHAVPARDATHAESFVALHLGLRIALIGGTDYAGEIKTTVFAMMNHLLAESDVLPLHGAVNTTEDGDSLLLLGPEGSGKSALIADPNRDILIDDIAGWNDKHLFNFEAGCYARVNHINADKEPVIHASSQSFGSILENVSMDHRQRSVDFQHCPLTENTRAAYPLTASSITPNMATAKHSNDPKHIVLLCCDAFGVLPAISRLTPEQVMYYYLLGYASHATENTQDAPIATFTPCCGMPLMPHHPSVYAKILGAKVRSNNTQCWLLNTGYSGGPAGIGERMDISLTRTLLSAALQGSLDDLTYQSHPILGMQMPDQLDPINTWHDQDDAQSYITAAQQLAVQFKEAFAPFQDHMPAEVLAAGPK